VGTRALQSIVQSLPCGRFLELVLIQSGKDGRKSRLQGFAGDLLGAVNADGKGEFVRVLVTDDYKNVEGSSLVICSAALWPSPDLNIPDDPSGRLCQSFVNAPMVRDVARRLRDNCPATPLLLVTNQVDMMCHIARQAAPGLKVLGVTGGVDSSRLKQIIQQELNVAADALMIGFHNENMKPLLRSIRLRSNGTCLFPMLAGEVVFPDDTRTHEEFERLEKEKLTAIIKKVKTLGRSISELQREGTPSAPDTGASILPARAIARFVSAYCFGEAMVESYNVLIEDEKVAGHYGVQVGTELSIPVSVYCHRLELDTTYALLDDEKQAMVDAQKSLNGQLDHLKRVLPQS